MIKALNNNEVSFVLVTLSYWFFMLTDGALRMLVLLHFHTLGFSPLQLAYLFLLYEFFGMVTNLTAGWIARKIGLNITLFSGMILQIVSLLLLTQVDKSWSITSSVIFVMATQGLSGIAKDLTKMSSKSSVKLLAPDKNNKLFQWVTLMTGSKNAVKGFGFLLGSLLLAFLGFQLSLILMAGLLSIILILVFVYLNNDFSKIKKEEFLISTKVGRLVRENSKNKISYCIDDWTEKTTIYFGDETMRHHKQSSKNSNKLINASCGAVLIGPEGGFTTKEISYLRQKKFVIPINFGPRILKSDTAVVTALVLWHTLNGDMKNSFY